MHHSAQKGLKRAKFIEIREKSEDKDAMKKSFKWKLIAGLAAVASLFIFTGCKLGESLADVKEKYNLTARVTYYANSVGGEDTFKTDGQFENTQGVKDVYYTTGAYAARIGEKSIPNVSLTHYAHSFEGWYHVAKDDQGRLLFVDENGEELYQGEDEKLYYKNKDGNPVLEDEDVSTVPVRSTEAVDFTKTLAEGDHWTICADWDEMSRLYIKLVCDDLATGEKIAGTTMEGKEASYGNGEDVWVDFFDGEEDTVQALGTAPFNVPDKSFTFVEFYTSAECTEPFTAWPIRWNENDQTIYAKYIKGDWKILKTAEDVGKIFTETVDAASRYYLIKDIDCSELSVAPINQFRGELQGNGYKISNFVVTLGKSDLRLDNGKKVALFGRITSTAKIQHIEFKDMKVEYPTKTGVTNWTCYFLFYQFDLGAVVNSVKLGGLFNFVLGDENSKPMNIMQNSEDWKYGTVADGADISGFDMSGVSAPTFAASILGQN